METTKGNLLEWLSAHQSKNEGQMIVQMENDFNMSKDWRSDQEGIRRNDGAFWKVARYVVKLLKDLKEVGGWDQPLIEEVGEGTVAIITTRITEKFII